MIRTGLIGLVTAALLGIGAAPAAPANGADQKSDRVTDDHARTVTLITGDRVRVSGAGEPRADVERAAGREGVRFSSYRIDGHQYVVPEDARHLVREGRVDRRLFDVTALVKAEHDDRATELPLTVDGTERRVPTAKLASFWKSLRGTDSTVGAAGGGGFEADSSPSARMGVTRALTVRHLGRDGAPAADAETMVIGLNVPVREFLHDEDGTADLRLPPGRYMLVSDIVDRNADWHRIVRPLLDLTRDTRITADARTTEPVTTTVARKGARPAAVDVGIERRFGDSVFSVSLGSTTFGRLYTAQQGPSVADGEMTSGLSSTWGVPGPAGDFKNTPYSYHLLNTKHGGFFTGFARTVHDAELARVDAAHNTQTAERRGVKGFFGMAPGFAAVSGTMLPFDLPARVTHYLDTRDTQWSGAFGEQITGADGFPVYATAMGSDYRAYRAGERTTERWNAAVFAPFLFRPDHAGRDGDRMWAGVPLFTDQDDHRAGSLTDSASVKLYRDGKLVGESDGGQLNAQVPPGKAGFRIESTADRRSLFRLSNQVKSVWTFTSDTTGEAAPLPLWVVRYFPRVDLYNNPVGGKNIALPLSAEPHPGAGTGQVSTLRISVSTDQGDSWRQVPVVHDKAGKSRAMVPRPSGAKSISLRAQLTDSRGNTLEQTTMNALRTDRTAPPAPPAPPTSPRECISAPETPHKSSSGFRILSSARNACGTPTTFWLMRYDAGRSEWHSVTENVIPAGGTASAEWLCKGSGTHTYRAVQFDPNMMFNKPSPVVSITC